MKINYTLTTTEHSECDKCIACIPNAEMYADVTGSIGATYCNDERCIGGLEHSATVARDK